MSVFVTRPRDDLVSVDTTAMLGWWLFDEGTGDAIHDRTGNGATILRGGTSPTATNRPTWVPPRGLQFDGTSDFAVAPASVTGAICATNRPVVEMVLTQPTFNTFRNIYALGATADVATMHISAVIDPTNSRVSFSGKRTDGATLTVVIPFSDPVWPGTGQWLYLLHAGGLRSVNLRSLTGAFSGTAGGDYATYTDSHPLLISAANASGTTRFTDMTVRHLAIYDGNHARCQTHAALTAMADSQYSRFRAIGLMS